MLYQNMNPHLECSGRNVPICLNAIVADAMSFLVTSSAAFNLLFHHSRLEALHRKVNFEHDRLMRFN